MYTSYLACRNARQFSGGNIPADIRDGFLHFKERLMIVFVNCAFNYSPQITIRGCIRFGGGGGQMPFEIIVSPNTSRRSVMETRAVCAVARSCWK
jgi:hypothetical protein